VMPELEVQDHKQHEHRYTNEWVENSGQLATTQYIGEEVQRWMKVRQT